jgi:hypothetical protein
MIDRPASLAGSLQQEGTMKMTSKRTVLVLAGVSCAGWLAGCETMALADPEYNAAAEAAMRVRVVAELREAQRLGLITVGEEDIPWITEEQSRLIARAGDGGTVADTQRPK